MSEISKEPAGSKNAVREAPKTECDSSQGENEQYFEEAFAKGKDLEAREAAQTLQEERPVLLQPEKKGIRKRLMSYFKKPKQESEASEFYKKKSDESEEVKGTTENDDTD